MRYLEWLCVARGVMLFSPDNNAARIIILGSVNLSGIKIISPVRNAYRRILIFANSMDSHLHYNAIGRTSQFNSRLLISASFNSVPSRKKKLANHHRDLY